MNARLTCLLATGLLSLVTACGGGDAKTLVSDGEAALNSGDAAGAIAKFDAALGQLEASDPMHERAQMGRIEALAYTDAAKCVAEVRGLASELEDRDFSTIGGALADAGNITAAVDVLDAGMKAHPDSTNLAALKDRVVAVAQKSGDSAALAKLKGLGYL
jgi:hypothetical protein